MSVSVTATGHPAGLWAIRNIAIKMALRITSETSATLCKVEGAGLSVAMVRQSEAINGDGKKRQFSKSCPPSTFLQPSPKVKILRPTVLKHHRVTT